VNELNRRAAKDTVDQAFEQVAEAQARTVHAQTALTDFRSREKLIDPNRASVAGSDIVSQLDAQILNLRASATVWPRSPRRVRTCPPRPEDPAFEPSATRR